MADTGASQHTVSSQGFLLISARRQSLRLNVSYFGAYGAVGHNYHLGGPPPHLAAIQPFFSQKKRGGKLNS